MTNAQLLKLYSDQLDSHIGAMKKCITDMKDGTSYDWGTKTCVQMARGCVAYILKECSDEELLRKAEKLNCLCDDSRTYSKTKVRPGGPQSTESVRLLPA